MIFFYITLNFHVFEYACCHGLYRRVLSIPSMIQTASTTITLPVLRYIGHCSGPDQTVTVYIHGPFYCICKPTQLAAGCPEAPYRPIGTRTPWSAESLRLIDWRWIPAMSHAASGPPPSSRPRRHNETMPSDSQISIGLQNFPMRRHPWYFGKLGLWPFRSPKWGGIKEVVHEAPRCRLNQTDPTDTA